ncbi:MAG TPA: protein kinase [Thermoanaerobaculia bacterium]|jgi:TolB-like protein/Flp pilus assembly protein TadD|nr:protein kinase [Thermoanaerobaculia bacterium]
MIGQTLLHYRVLSKIGEGGMGEVFLALDTKLERQVALKVLPHDMASNPRRWERFVREARAIAALNHPNIVTIFAVEEAEGRHFFAMELIEGETLERIVHSPGLELDRFFSIATPLVDALAAAHRQGILHRDLKPENVMVGRDGRVKVLDFGVAKAIGQQEKTEAAGMRRRNLTEEGSVLGTARYMSPEQACGEPVDQRTDIFSLGIVLFEMATGSYPFQGRTAAEVLSSILRDEPPLAHTVRRELPTRLSAAIHRCMLKRIELRYGSADELGRDLDAVRRELAATPVRHGVDRTVAEPVARARVADRQYGPSGITKTPSPALAVLPLVDLAAGPDYFVEGLTEELITAVAKVGSMRVISRQSIMRYRGSDKPLPEIASELGVDHILQGSVLRAGDRVRISLQLVRADPEEHLWAERYERSVGDVLAVQHEIARAVASEILSKLTFGDDVSEPAAPVAPEVLEAYLKGRYYVKKRTHDSSQKALTFFQEAIDRDPLHAPSHAGYADALALIGHERPSPQIAERARAAARRALELDPALAEAHASLGFISFYYEWDWAAAEAEFQRALELAPNEATIHHWYWSLLVTTGRREEAGRQIRLACQLDPLSPIIVTNLGVHYYLCGDPVRAVRQVAKALDIEPEFRWAHLLLWRAQEQLGELDAAVRSLARGLRGLSRDDVAATVERLYPQVGYGPAAQAAAEQLMTTGPAPVPLDTVAMLYLANNCREQAMALVEEAFAARLTLVVWLAVAPEWAPLRDDPRMQRLLSRVHLQAGPAAGGARVAPA